MCQTWCQTQTDTMVRDEMWLLSSRAHALLCLCLLCRLRSLSWICSFFSFFSSFLPSFLPFFLSFFLSFLLSFSFSFFPSFLLFLIGNGIPVPMEKMLGQSSIHAVEGKNDEEWDTLKLRWVSLSIVILLYVTYLKPFKNTEAWMESWLVIQEKH